MKHKFLCEKKTKLGAGGKVSVTPVGSRTNYIFGAEELAIAELFDGDRSSQDVLMLYRSKGPEIAKEDFDDFVGSLVNADFLQEIPEGSDVVSFPRRVTVSTPLTEMEESGREPSLLLLDEEYAAQRAVAHGLSDFDYEESDLNLATEAEQQSARPPTSRDQDLQELYDDGRFSTPKDSLISRQSRRSPLSQNPSNDDELLGPVAADDFSESQANEEEGLKKNPVSAWLLPYANVLVLPARNALFGFFCLAAALSAGYLLWSEKTVGFADLMFRPEHLAQLLWLVPALIAVSYIVQLARSAAHHDYSATPIPPNVVAGENYALPDRKQRIMLASSLSCMLVFALSVGIWSILPDDQILWRSAAFAFVAISSIFILKMANPLANSEGYYLLAAKLETPNLMQTSIRALLWDDISVWFFGRRAVALWTYALVTVAYYGCIGALSYAVITTHVGPFLGLWLIALLTVTFVPAASALWGSFRLQAVARRKATLNEESTPRFRQLRPAVRPLLRYALVLLICIYLGSVPYTYHAGGDFRILPNQRVDARALTSGEIKEVYVKEGNIVSAGQIIAQLNDDTQQTEVAVSQFTIDERKAKLAMAVNGATREEIDLARQRIKTAITRREFSTSRAKRYQELHEKGVASHQDYEDTLKEAEVDQEQLEAARRDLDLILAGTRPEAVDEIEAELAKEEAVLKYRRQQLAYTTVRAGASGMVVSGTLMFAVGDYVNKGDIIVEIEKTDKVRCEMRIPQADVGEITSGARVRVKAWAYPGREFQGVVTDIAPNAEATDFGRVVRVLSEIQNHDDLLKTELTGYGKIEGEPRPAFLAFTRTLARLFRVEFWSWIP